MDPRSAMHTFTSGVDEDSESDYCVETCSLVSSISTNATADNLPGPGRTLGLFYSFAGRHLEILLGRLAEKMGKGPRMTAIRIQRRRSKVTSLPEGSRKAKAKNAKIKKGCRKLVQYVKSNNISTKIQALDQITRLAIEDQFISDILLVTDAVHAIEPLGRWNAACADFYPVLLASSRKALISLADTEVNALAKELQADLHGDRELFKVYHSDFRRETIRRIKGYVNDPERAFLAIRHLGFLFHKYPSSCVYCAGRILNFTINLEESSLSRFEWNVLDQSIMQYLDVVERTGSIVRRIHVSPFLPELLLRFPDKLPRAIGSDFYSWLSAFDETEYGIDLSHAWLTFHLLRHIFLANRLEKNDGYEISSALLQDLYPQPLCQPLLSRLSCLPETLIYEFAAARNDGFDTLSFDSSQTPRIIAREEMESLCGQLSQCIDSEDSLVSKRALHAFKYMLTTDKYCRSASLRALSSTRFARTIDYEQLIEESEEKCIPALDTSGWTHNIVRHCNNYGHLLHLSEGIDIFTGHCCVGIEGTKRILEFESTDVLELRITRGKSFSAMGHNPLLAGTTSEGKQAYVAQIVGKGGNRYYVAITEGTKPEDLCVLDDWCDYMKTEVMVLQYVIVFVLRFSPVAYARCGRFTQPASEHEDGLDATGPFSWKPSVSDMESSLSDWDTDEDVAQVSESAESEEERSARSSIDDGVDAGSGKESAEDEWETTDECQ